MLERRIAELDAGIAACCADLAVRQGKLRTLGPTRESDPHRKRSRMCKARIARGRGEDCQARSGSIRTLFQDARFSRKYSSECKAGARKCTCFGALFRFSRARPRGFVPERPSPSGRGGFSARGTVFGWRGQPSPERQLRSAGCFSGVFAGVVQIRSLLLQRRFRSSCRRSQCAAVFLSERNL